MKIKRILLLAIFAACFIQTSLWARYQPHGGLLIKNLNFCIAKPRGIGRFEPVGKDGFKIGEDAYLYMEAENCKPEKSGKYYSLYVIINMDIYYEDGRRVYSEKDVKSFNPESPREFLKTFLWIKIETQYLKPGEYKVEIKVRDENSNKEAFALKKFKVYNG